MSKVNFKIIFALAGAVLSTSSVFAYKTQDIVDAARNNIQEEAVSYRQQGYKLQMAGNMSEALRFYEKAAAMDPHYAEVNNDIGVVYESQGDNQKAIAMYKKALDIDKNYLPAYTNLGFIYEKTGDVMNASEYWKRRYDLGNDGEYWKEVAREHLLKLGTYPQLQRERLEQQAAMMSRAMVYEREQARLKTIEEARLHYNIGANFMAKDDFVSALKEFELAIFLKPDDPELLVKVTELARTAQAALAKEMAKNSAQAALDSIKSEDYKTASDKLQEASGLVVPLYKGTTNAQGK